MLPNNDGLVKETFLQSQRALVALVASVISSLVALVFVWLKMQSPDLQAAVSPLVAAVDANSSLIAAWLVNQAVIWSIYIYGRTIRNTAV